MAFALPGWKYSKRLWVKDNMRARGSMCITASRSSNLYKGFFFFKRLKAGTSVCIVPLLFKMFYTINCKLHTTNFTASHFQRRGISKISNRFASFYLFCFRLSSWFNLNQLAEVSFVRHVVCLAHRFLSYFLWKLNRALTLTVLFVWDGRFHRYFLWRCCFFSGVKQLDCTYGARVTEITFEELPFRVPQQTVM